MSKFLVLLGPSGVGKSSILRKLSVIDASIVYIKPYTTRQLRNSEADKIHISLDELTKLRNGDKLIKINEIFGFFYAAPKNQVFEFLAQGKFPSIDWPLQDLADLVRAIGAENTHVVYVKPPSLNELFSRLQDGRDPDNVRFASAKRELDTLDQSLLRFPEIVKVVTNDNLEVSTLAVYNSLIGIN